MKRTDKFSGILFLFMVACRLFSAEYVELQCWDMETGKDRVVFVEKQQTYRGFGREGRYRLEVTRNEFNQRAISHIQCSMLYSDGLRAGTRYRAEVTIQSSRFVQIQAAVMQNKSPYRVAAARYYNLKPGEPVNVVLEFIPAADIAEPWRTPALFLGNADPGTVFEISRAVLYEVR